MRLLPCIFAFGLVLVVAAACHRPFYERDYQEPPTVRSPEPFQTDALKPSDGSTEAASGEPGISGGVYPGSDVFSRRAGGREAPVFASPEGAITLNFVDADLREVVQAVLGDALQANYVIDPSVGGTVTLRTSQPMQAANLIPALENVLAMNGAALVKAGDMFKVLPADQAARGTTSPTRYSAVAQGEGVGSDTIVVPLKHISAVEMEEVLEPFAPVGSILRVDKTRNLIVLTGNQAELASMVDVIETFDVDWLEGMSFGVFPVHTTDAETMVANLTEVFGSQEEGPLVDLVRFVPIERLNSVLVISPRANYLQKAETWIDRLDSGEAETQRIFVYYVQNSRAADLAQVLGQIFEGSTSGEVSRPDLAPGLQPVSMQSESAPSGQERQQRSETRSVRAFTSGSEESVALGAQGEIRVIADEVKNALVILATPRDFRIVEDALKKLDIVPLQVLIEATILEVQLTDNLKYGVEWFFKFGDSKIANITSGDDRLTGFGSLGGDLVQSAFPGFTYFFQNSDASVVVNALDDVSDLNVISSPQLFVLDNQAASLQVGDQVPITTQQQTGDEDTSRTVNSVEYRDTGVILNVTPRVNAGGLVTMELVQEVSDAIPTETSDLDSPTIQQRRIESTVAVQSGETVALGGLIRDRRVTGSTGFPFLSRIPVFGALFGVQNDTNTRTELLILITPRVVPNAARARELTRELRQRLKSLRPLEVRIE